MSKKEKEMKRKEPASLIKDTHANKRQHTKQRQEPLEREELKEETPKAAQEIALPKPKLIIKDPTLPHSQVQEPTMEPPQEEEPKPFFAMPPSPTMEESNYLAFINRAMDTLPTLKMPLPIASISRAF